MENVEKNMIELIIGVNEYKGKAILKVASYLQPLILKQIIYWELNLSIVSKISQWLTMAIVR